MKSKEAGGSESIKLATKSTDSEGTDICGTFSTFTSFIVQDTGGSKSIKLATKSIDSEGTDICGTFSTFTYPLCTMQELTEWSIQKFIMDILDIGYLESNHHVTL